MRPETRSLWIIPELLPELAVRVMLLLAVYVMMTCFEPHKQYITEAELLVTYKHPRRDSLAPAWVVVLVVIIIPLIFLIQPLLASRNYADTTQAFLAWTLALSINAVITEMLKLIVGRPRPDFFYRCFPNGKVTKEFRCTGETRDVIEGRKSFPSGHSSFSFCSMGFLSFWLCGKLGVFSRHRGHGLNVIVCILPLIIGAIIAISRCCDNHHHWEDVLIGSILGLVTSYFCYNQYFNVLSSDLSGYPYILTENLLHTFSQTECCTIR